jgi:P-type Cu+ transporter
LDLKVLEAYTRDAGRGVARIDYDSMDSLSASTGDVIEIKGKDRRTFVSVMIIACPCALGIATPAALMMGAGKGAENSILFKGGEYLEIARKVNTVVFDKTGTLTKGKPEVTDIITLSDSFFEERELLGLSAIAESGSEHPLGQAVVTYAKEKGIIVVSNPDSFEAVSGHGLRAKYGDHTILIGNRKLMEDNAISVTETG